MGEYARITPSGGVLIDTAAWITARAGGLRTDLTDQLHRWARHHRPETADPAAGSPTGWPALASTWCEHTGYRVVEPGLIVHDRTRLNTSVWVLPATTREDGPGAADRVVIVGAGGHLPAVYADTTTDPWAWWDADTVTITCPAGHWWTWRSGRELLTSTGRPTTLTVVFGPSLDAPFSPCPDCAAHQLGHHPSRCGCDGTPWIVCPVCGRRCHLGPPHP
jgi:hypothetical protein